MSRNGMAIGTSLMLLFVVAGCGPDEQRAGNEFQNTLDPAAKAMTTDEILNNRLLRVKDRPLTEEAMEKTCNACKQLVTMKDRYGEIVPELEAAIKAPDTFPGIRDCMQKALDEIKANQAASGT